MNNPCKLCAASRALPEDYEPWGLIERRGTDADCSMGCKWFRPLAMQFEGEIVEDGDHGVCTNPKSHRRGLLTFEHQGCRQFEEDDDAGRFSRGGSRATAGRSETNGRIAPPTRK